ncbi:DUF6445 family protein [Sphingomonas sp. URHD0057]|uniref:DUF6445 family protein n=1 Tax=Sphingomonas sp. URHD0057 TaxID=1380389 RepID=UPI00055E42D1|nr:DUF6445 family protein [Sphingomonas sp. URHD0057]
MAMSLIIIDDFLAEPEVLRQRALSLKYENAGTYPGRNSIERIKIESLADEVSFIVRERLCEPTPPQSHAKCRLTLASDNEPGRIHVDPSVWSGILYLSRPEDCRGGTEFYRHIPTGTDEVPRKVEQINALGYAASAEMGHQILEKDGGDRSKWELTMTVPMRYNRLVLLRPWLWHTSGPGFGDSAENGRLVYLMFFFRPAPLHPPQARKP